MRRFGKWLAVLLAAAAPLAHAGKYTDLWWNPQQSGWGVNVVQQLETAFVTLFVYGADGKPTWYVAPAAHVVAYQGARPIFSGELYRAEGPAHTGPFDPSKVKPHDAGQLSLEILADDRLRLYYNVEGSPQIVKELTRQTWQQPVLAANYLGQFILRQALPGGAPYGTRVYSGELLLHADGDQAYLRVDDHLGRRCEYRGTYQQAGKIARIAGSFDCTSGEAGPGTFEVTDLEVSDHGITGYLRTWSGVTEFGRFSATRQ